MTLGLRYIAQSDRGLVRSNNEDSAYAGARLLALADGMGGHAAGEVASQLVIQALRTLDDDEPGGNLLEALDAATRHGNEAIAAQVARNPELDGMGTTLTAILFAGTKIGLCHVGDSRGYLLRDGVLTQITRDDTFVQSLVDEGRITAEQAHTHPQRSLIMKALTGQEVEPTLTMREARAGDRYLLCSDGLSDVVSDETLAETLSSVADLPQCANRLIELALRSGAPDNVTVVLADVVDNEFGDSRPILGGAASGDDQAGYTPDPSTAAGRAAALRPPPTPTQRPTINDEPPTADRHRPWRPALLLIGTLLVVGALITAFFVVRAQALSNYFVTADGSSVVIHRGTPGGILFLDFNEPSEKVCVTNLDQDKPDVTFVDVDSATACDTMRVADLTGVGQTTVETISIKNLPRAEIHETVRTLEFLPLCVSPTPVPDPNDTSPEPNPRTSERPTSSATSAPESSPAAPTVDDEGRKTCREPR